VNILLWVLQVILAILYLRHGLLLVFPPESARAMVEAMSLVPGLPTFIGIAEWLAAAGLILPGVTRIMPWLTIAAAGGLVIVMTGAVVYHISRGEIGLMLYTGLLLVLVGFVGYMRWKVVPLSSQP
jgi:hypothetical protein